MAAIQQGVTLRRAPQPAEGEGPAFSAHDQLMGSIRGGVALRSAPRPQERPPGEEKVMDFASELRLKMMKHRKQEVSQVQGGQSFSEFVGEMTDPPTTLTIAGE